jgi:hypothetical protein
MPLQTGAVTLGSSLQFTVPAAGVGLSSYNVPGGFSLATGYTSGTGPNQVMKFALFGGTATAAPATLDLSSIPCVDGTTSFTHVREIIIINNDPINLLKFDPTVSSSQLFGMEVAAKIDIQAGANLRFFKPLGTNGFVVGGSTHIVTLDPGANTIIYSGIVVGD